MSDLQLKEKIKSHIKSNCLVLLDEDDDRYTKQTFISIYAKNLLSKSELDNSDINSIIEEICVELEAI